MPPRKRLGQLLTELGVVDEHQIQSALGHQKQWGGKLGAILVQKGFCSEPAIVSALAKHLGMPMVSLATARIDPRAIKFVSKQIAEKLHVFPYEVTGSGRSEVVTIAMSDPTDLAAVDQLAFHTGKRIKPMLAGDSDIISAISQHYGAADDKKVPTDKVPQAAGTVPPPAPAAAASTAPFPRRFDPQAPGARASTPPPTPAEPSPQAAPEPLDLPESEDDGKGQMFGLEPIAAHTQVDAVEGAQDLSADGAPELTAGGAPADPVEGFEAAGVRHEGADDAWGVAASGQASSGDQSGTWQAEPPQEWAEPAAPAADAAWSADPASAPAPWSDPLAPGAWPAATETGAAQETQDDAAAAPDEWATASDDPLAVQPSADAASGGDADGGETGAGDWSEPAPPSAPRGDTPGEPWSETPALAGDWGEPADAPPEWTDAPAADAPAHGIAEQEGAQAEGAAEAALADAQMASLADDDFEIEHDPVEEPSPELGPRAEAYGEEQPGLESSGQPAPDPATEFELEGEPPQEGWVAPSEPQEQGWTPGAQGTLSLTDEGTLAMVGVDPNDGAAALRTLAALVRVLQRRQLLDPDELAAELREGRPSDHPGQQAGAAPEDFSGHAPEHPPEPDPMAQDAPAAQDLEGSPEV